MKKFNVIFMLLILLFPVIVNAQDEYKVNSYEIEITIDKEENYYDEHIEAEFYNENVLIKKELPKSATDIEVDTDFIISAPFNKIIEINSTNKDSKIYNYKYKDITTNNKDLYEIKILNNYNNDLNNINFVINMKEPFSKQNIEFYVNDNKIKNLDFKIKGNQLFGKYDFLAEGESLTIKINYEKLYLNNFSLLSIITPIILSLLSLLIWYLYGKDLRLPIEKVSKFSSKLNILDIALIKKGKVEHEDSFYLLLSLANNGYIKIIENSNNDYTIVRDKPYNGKKYSEASFIKALFKKSETISLTEYLNVIAERKTRTSSKDLESIILIDSLKRRFKIASNHTLSIINTPEERVKYFEEISDKMKIFLVFAIAIILVLVTSLPFLEINNYILLPLSTVFSIVTLFILMKFVEETDLKKKNSKIVVFAILSILVLLVLLVPVFKRNRIYLIAYLISCVSVSFILFLYKYMPKRTLYGTKEYTKIEGFKLFINELSNKELDSILELNDNYLYDILPYSYMLGVSDKVFKKLKEYSVKEPSWFILKDKYTHQKLNNAINRLKNILEKDEDF